MKKKIIITSTFIILIAASVITFLLLNKKEELVQLKDANITHDGKFGGIYVEELISDFNKLGFEFGDSVDVEFSNGYKLEDLPYYNGYYVDIDETLVLGYHNHDKIEIGINYGDDLWEVAAVNEKDTVTITLNEKKKYLKEQEASDIHYSDEQGDMSDIEFGNFRNVKVGELKDNILYRSASPIDNSHKRASVVDKLIKNVNIGFIIDLSDDKEEVIEHLSKEDFNSPYFKSLYENNKVITLSMDMKFKDTKFESKLKELIEAMSNNEGPYLIHCVEGKDRTGFVSMIIESLAGAKYNEMVNDYMITYDNYYDINLQTDKEKYNTIKEKNIDLMLAYISGLTKEDDLTKVNYEQAVIKYLKNIGISEETIYKLQSKIKKQEL